MSNLFEKLKSIGIIPVVCINDADNAPRLARALFEGGISAIEITFRSKAAAEAIKKASEEVPELLIIAGTILNVTDAKKAVEAGAQVIVSPGTNQEVVKWCVENKIDIIPGCATPTEVEACMRMGLKAVKLFPAEVVGGVKLLKALYGPYRDMLFMPTGGINSKNLKEYLELPNVLACGGSWIAPDKLIDEKNFDEIARLAAEAIEAAGK